MVDQGFPRGHANLLFDIIFAENCLKMKTIALRGSVREARPLDPPLVTPARTKAI